MMAIAAKYLATCLDTGKYRIIPTNTGIAIVRKLVAMYRAPLFNNSYVPIPSSTFPLLVLII